MNSGANRDAGVVILGAGIMGTSVLFYLISHGYDQPILVIEREPAPARGMTALSAGGFRNLWTTPINMRIMSAAIPRLASFRAEMGRAIGYEPRGYLFCQYAGAFEASRRFAPRWDEHGIRYELLDPAAIEKRIPGIRCGVEHIDPEVRQALGMEPIAGGVFGPDCGSFDPSAAAVGYLEKAIECARPDQISIRLGAAARRLTRDRDGNVSGVELEDGDTISARTVVLAVGPQTVPLLSASGFGGADLPPVVPWQRMLFVVTAPQGERFHGFEEIPLTVIDDGIYFRPEAGGMLIGRADPEQPYGFEMRVDPNYYLEKINFILQERLPGAERCRPVSRQSMWAGLYQHNTADHNSIIGEHPSCKGLYVMTGFSGHGAMQAPVFGEAIAELVLYGQYRALDLSSLGMERFATGALINETIVI